jgi:hypothetical protein
LNRSTNIALSKSGGLKKMFDGHSLGGRVRPSGLVRRGGLKAHERAEENRQSEDRTDEYLESSDFGVVFYLPLDNRSQDKDTKRDKNDHPDEEVRHDLSLS